MMAWWRNTILKISETPKFQKQRKKLRTYSEKTALREAAGAVATNPLSGKRLKGEFKISGA